MSDQNHTYGPGPGLAQALNLARLMLISGDARDRFSLASDLKQAGAIVDPVSEPDDMLLSLERARRDGEPYDAVLLDADGFNDQAPVLAGMIRQTGYAGPILVLTSESPKRMAGTFIEEGCDELIQKPVPTPRLYRTLSDLIERSRSTPPPACNPDEVTSELAGYPELSMMLRRFVANLPETIETLLAAQRERDIQRLRDELEQVKRRATSHGYTEIRASAVQARQALDQARHPDAEQVQQAIDDLVDLCRRATANPVIPPPTDGPPLPPSG